MLACAKKLKGSCIFLVAQGRWTDAKKAQNPMVLIDGETLGRLRRHRQKWSPRRAKVFGLNTIGYDPYIMHPWLAKENGFTGEFCSSPESGPTDFNIPT